MKRTSGSNIKQGRVWARALGRANGEWRIGTQIMIIICTPWWWFSILKLTPCINSKQCQNYIVLVTQCPWHIKLVLARMASSWQMRHPPKLTKCKSGAYKSKVNLSIAHVHNKSYIEIAFTTGVPTNNPLRCLNPFPTHPSSSLLSRFASSLHLLLILSWP